MLLSELRKGQQALVDSVHEQSASDPIAQRLRDIGFVLGERVRLVTTGPFGSEPLLIEVAGSRFALRKAEAMRVRLQTGSAA
jgi:ferrous iron transport protein A